MTGAVSAIAGSAAATAVAGGAAIDAGTALAGGSLASAVGAAALPSFSTLSLIGTGIGAAGQIASSQAAAGAAGYKSKVASENAQLDTQNANYAGAQGEQNVGAVGASSKTKLASTLANQGASGINVNTGSAVDVRESEAKLGMLNALNVRTQAAQKAYGFQVDSASDKAQSNLYASESSNDKTAGYLNAGTTVLGGLAKASAFSTAFGNQLAATDPTGMITGGGGAISGNYANSFAPIDYPG